jgi:hypothetical protein
MTYCDILIDKITRIFQVLLRKEKNMKVVAINGSPRKEGNTAKLIGHVFSELEKKGVRPKLSSLAIIL